MSPREPLLTPSDRAWLEAMNRAMKPTPMVSAETYGKLLQSCDRYTLLNQELVKEAAVLRTRAMWHWYGHLFSVGILAGAIYVLLFRPL